jgi:4-hydroxy-4-methyl-2-oxoglutarate aldolase
MAGPWPATASLGGRVPDSLTAQGRPGSHGGDGSVRRMTDATEFEDIPTTTLADLLGHEQVLDLGVRALWGPMPRLAGPAFTVRCPPGDNLMLHAAIYRAEPGSVVVVESGDVEYALAGGNVCAVAQGRGIAGFVVDGVIRDVGEVRAAGFPVFGRGVVPIPGVKKAVLPLNERVRCGGVAVDAGDVVVADEDGVVVVPGARRAEVLAGALARLVQEGDESLDEWEAAHRAKVDELLRAGGFEG